MGSFLSDSEKNQINSVFDHMHDTFARDINIFQRENEIFVATNGTYNALYARIKNTPTTSCLLYTSPSPRDRTRSRMPSSA